MLPFYGCLVLASLANLATSCNLPARTGTPGSANATEFPKKYLGNDPPAPPATLGFSINHFALVVNDIAATKKFYGDVLGMRTVFSAQLTAEYDILYMGYAHGGKNGTGFQTGEQLNAQKNNIEGLIEFVGFRGGNTRKYTGNAAQTFSHIGLIVPDIEAAQARMEENNINIIKRTGEKAKQDSVIPGAFGIAGPGKAQALLPALAAIGFDSFMVVADPDGNLLEVQQQVQPAGVV